MKITCVMPRVLLSFDRIRTDSKCVLWESTLFPWALALYTIVFLQHLISCNEQFSCRPIIFSKNVRRCFIFMDNCFWLQITLESKKKFWLFRSTLHLKRQKLGSLSTIIVINAHTTNGKSHGSNLQVILSDKKKLIFLWLEDFVCSITAMN